MRPRRQRCKCVSAAEGSDPERFPISVLSPWAGPVTQGDFQSDGTLESCPSTSQHHGHHGQQKTALTAGWQDNQQPLLLFLTLLRTLQQRRQAMPDQREGTWRRAQCGRGRQVRAAPTPPSRRVQALQDAGASLASPRPRTHPQKKEERLEPLGGEPLRLAELGLGLGASVPASRPGLGHSP